MVPGQRVELLRQIARDNSSSLEGIVKASKLLATVLGFLAFLMLYGSAFAQTAPTAPIVLKGAPMGAVRILTIRHT